MTDAEIDKMCYPEAADLIGELHGKIAFLKELLAWKSSKEKLTDEEREAVDMAIDSLRGVEDVSAGASSRADAAAATLRGLLERLTDRAPGT